MKISHIVIAAAVIALAVYLYKKNKKG